MLEQFIPIGLSVLVVSVMMMITYMQFYNNDVNVIVIYLNNQNHAINVEMFNNTNDIYIDSGYKLDQYKYNKDQNTIFIFVKEHEYNFLTVNERVRHFTFDHTKSITLHENYKEDISK